MFFKTKPEKLLKIGPMVRFLFLRSSVLMTVVLVGCVPSQTKEPSPDNAPYTPVLSMPDIPFFDNIERGSSEELLAAEGNWNLVEEGNVDDPALAHLNARKKVDPKKFKKRDDLIARFEPNAQSGRDGKFRVLRMEPQGSDAEQDLEGFGDMQVTETAIVKPTQKVAGTELLAKIKTVFEESAQNQSAPEIREEENVAAAEAVPVPASKPFKLTEDTIPTAESADINASAYKTANGIVVPPKLPVRKAGNLASAQVVMPPPSAKTILPTPAAEQKKGPLSGILGILTRPAKPAAQPQAQKPNVKYEIIASGETAQGTAKVTALRSAMHPGKTRIAMDLSSSVKYKVAIDHIRNVLRIKLEKTKWTIALQNTLTGSPLLGSYVARQQSDGSVILEIRLKKKTKILDTMILRPDKSINHRVVVDLEG